MKGGLRRNRLKGLRGLWIVFEGKEKKTLLLVCGEVKVVIALCSIVWCRTKPLIYIRKDKRLFGTKGCTLEPREML